MGVWKERQEFIFLIKYIMESAQFQHVGFSWV